MAAVDGETLVVRDRGELPEAKALGIGGGLKRDAFLEERIHGSVALPHSRPLPIVGRGRYPFTSVRPLLKHRNGYPKSRKGCVKSSKKSGRNKQTRP